MSRKTVLWRKKIQQLGQRRASPPARHEMRVGDRDMATERVHLILPADRVTDKRGNVVTEPMSPEKRQRIERLLDKRY